MQSFLLKTRSLKFLTLLMLVMVSGVLFLVLPDNFTLLGYQNVSGDLAQHLSGWYAFVQEPWHFPLLKITSLNYPIGTTISLTDSIPLFALVFKLLRAILPYGFNYFAIFIILSYLFQGIAALVLAISLQKKSILGVCICVALALTSPILKSLIDLSDSLGCQGFILLALSGYFFVEHKKLNLTTLHVFFGLLIGISLLVHPYLTAMVYPFYLISVFRLKRIANLAWKNCCIAIVWLHASILLEFFVFGLAQDQNGKVCGFGYFAMNMLAPFYGGRFTHYQTIFAYSAQAITVYLGMGLILMLIISIGLYWRDYRRIFKRYRALWLVTLGFFIYAIYGNIYLGHHQILTYGVPHFFLTCAFRANNRFFWPVWYVLMIMAFVGIMTKKPRVAVWALPILLVLQFWDVFGYAQIEKSTLESNFTQVSDPSIVQINKLIASSKIVIFYPKIACSMTSEDWFLLINTQELVAKQGIRLNTAYAAHFKSPNCDDDANAFPALSPKLLVSGVDTPSPTIQDLLRTNKNSCVIINQAYYCEYP